MGLFDDQIRHRKSNDDKVFETAFVKFADALLGEGRARARENSEGYVKSAVNEILQYYHVSLRTLPEKTENADKIAESLFLPRGIYSRKVNLEPGWYKNAFGAMLGSMKDSGRIVALIPSGLSGYTFYNENVGKRVHVDSKNESLFNMEAVCFYRPLPPRSLKLNDLFEFAIKALSMKEAFIILFSLAMASLLGLLVPKVNYFLVSSVVEKKDFSLLASTMVFFVSLGIARLLFDGVQTILATRVSQKMEFTVQSALMMRLISLPVSFFKKYSSGDLTLRINEIGKICSSLFESFFVIGLTAIFSLVYFTQILSYASSLFLPALCVVIFISIFSVHSMRAQVKVAKKNCKIAISESGMSFAMIMGMQKIKLAGAEKRAFARWADLKAKEASLLYNPPALVKYNMVAITAVSLLGTFAMYFSALRTGVSVPEYFAFNSAYAMIIAAFTKFSEMSFSVANVRPYLEMVVPVLETVPESTTSKVRIEKPCGSFELSNVYFRYGENTPWILESLSLKIKEKDYVAIVGKSGCGKSTLLRLLQGFEKPSRGAVFFDGRDLTSIDMKSLRRKNFGVVLQKDRLIADSIYANIALSSPGISMEDAWRAAEIAGLSDDIKQMPMGMHTVVSDAYVSGGQKQRILIARSLACNPTVLLYDEATSALDNITQKKVVDALDGLGCTRIVVAHRLSTIKHCNRIVVLDKGRIVEDGDYDSLMAKKGFFAKLVENQHNKV